MSAKTVDKKKLIAEGQKLLNEAIAGSAALAKAASDEMVFYKQAKAMRAKIIKLIKQKPFDAKKVKAATDKFNAYVKQGKAKSATAMKAAASKLQASAKGIDTFLKNNKSHVGKTGATQFGKLSKTLGVRLKATQTYIKVAQ